MSRRRRWRGNRAGEISPRIVSALSLADQEGPAEGRSMEVPMQDNVASALGGARGQVEIGRQRSDPSVRVVAYPERLGKSSSRRVTTRPGSAAMAADLAIQTWKEEEMR